MHCSRNTEGVFLAPTCIYIVFAVILVVFLNRLTMIRRSMTVKERSKLLELRALAADHSDASAESDSLYQENGAEVDFDDGQQTEEEESEDEEVERTIDRVIAAADIAEDVDADPNLDKTSKAGKLSILFEFFYIFF